MGQSERGPDNDRHESHELLERNESAANIGPGSDSSYAGIPLERNTQSPAPAQTGIDQPVVACVEEAADAEEMGTRTRDISNVEPPQSKPGYGTEGLVTTMQPKGDGAAAPTKDATEPADLANAEISDGSLLQADASGKTTLEVNSATKNVKGCQNPTPPDASDPSTPKYKRPRRGGGRVRPCRRTWEEMPFGDLDSLVGVFMDDMDIASMTSKLPDSISDGILDEDKEWTDALLEDDNLDAFLAESPSRQEWLRQKREGNEHNEYLDSIMSMVGHEQVKAHFLDVKATVEAAKRWGEDVKRLKLDLILHGNDGTGPYSTLHSLR